MLCHVLHSKFAVGYKDTLLAPFQIFINYETLPLRQPLPASAPFSRVTHLPSSVVLGRSTTFASAWYPRTQSRYPVCTPRNLLHTTMHALFNTFTRAFSLASSALPCLGDGNSYCPTGSTNTPHRFHVSTMMTAWPVILWWGPTCSCPSSLPFRISPFITRRSSVVHTLVIRISTWIQVYINIHINLSPNHIERPEAHSSYCVGNHNLWVLVWWTL